MDHTITDLQKRRADNIIWTCADDYSFAPDFKAYDENGDVDLYWNVIFGSARRHYEYGKLEKLFAMLDKYKNSALYEAVFWNALEPVLFRTELTGRPVLERIRPEPAESQLKFDENMTTDEIVETARQFFYDHYGLYGDGKIRLKYRLPRFRRVVVDSFLQRGVNGVYQKWADFPFKYFLHEKGLYEEDSAGFSHYSVITKMTESELREFLETKFGKSIY
ncbi:MAG: hypothetical protein IKT07_02825, partial [Oscillospiraceae bacterium]|nr:hypothetical protein [Oscillospiraceae bacterium]